MRIVDVCAFYCAEGGGVRTYIERKWQAMRAQGHEMIVVAPGEQDSIVHRAPGAWLATIAAPQFPLDRRYRYFDDELALHRELDRWQPDIVEASSPWSSASMVARWPGSAARSLVMHADPIAAYAYRWFGRLASKSTIDRWFQPFWSHLRDLDRASDLVVSASPSLSGRLAAHGIGKVATIPMGVEPGLFSPRLRSPELRRELLARCGLDDNATLLLGVGRIASEKRWPMVIAAVAEVARTAPIGLVLVGDGRDHAKVSRAAQGCSRIFLPGAVTDRHALARLYASSDALVHGCEAETFCMAASEARASGLPLIVPDSGGAFDQLLAGAGVVYRAGSRISLMRAIRRFLDRGVERQRLVACAEAEVRTMDEHFAELSARYRTLVHGRSAAA